MMKALIVADAHLFRTPDGAVWTEAIYGYEFWQRYLEVFESIDVAARMDTADYKEIKGYLRSDGENVSFRPMPMARSAKQYILKFFKFLSSAREAVKGEKCAIIRLPSFTALFIYKYIRKAKIPFSIEIVADPSIANDSLVNRVLVSQLKKAALKANGVAYVTKYALQKNYPSYAHINGETKTHFEEHYSSIKLDQKLIGKPKKYREKIDCLKLVHTSNSISHDGKGHSVVIKVIQQLVASGYNAEVTFIGDGSLIHHFQEQASELGISEKVHFIGRLRSSIEVRNELAKHDVFIFPSKSEGLPRALIEAMAVGLPCLSTPVGGIPELVDEDYLYDPLDVEGFTKAIQSFIDNPQLMESISEKNIERVKEYETSVLQSRRNAFFKKLINLVE